MDLMKKKSGRVCCKSVAMLLVLCVVLVGCSGSSDQTDATILPTQQATTSAGMVDALAGNTVASLGETEVMESVRTSPSSGLAASSADDREEAAVIQQSAESEETPIEEASIQDECQTPEVDVAETTENTVLTDFITGKIILSDDEEPMGLESIYIRTYPGFWESVDLDNISDYARNYPGPQLPDEWNNDLHIELRDSYGTAVYCSPFILHPIFRYNFLARIPDPPDYDRIAIVKLGEDIGEVWRSRNTPIVEDLKPEHGSIFCYNDVIRGLTDIKVTWSPKDKDIDSTTPSVNGVSFRWTDSVWISTDGGATFKYIDDPSLGTYFDPVRSIDPIDLHKAEDVYVRVHVSDSTRTSYAETYFTFDPSACSPEQQQFESFEETSPERRVQEISAETECELPRLNLEDEQNEDRLDHVIDAQVFSSYEREPLGFSSFKIEMLAIPRISSNLHSWSDNLPKGTIELRDKSGQPVVNSQYEISWPQLGMPPRPPRIPGDIYLAPNYDFTNFSSGAFPNPSEYESIAVLYAGEEIGVFHKSANSPVVEIVSPGCGEVYQSGDTIRMTWYGYDLDADDLDYEVWYSTDERESYRKKYLEDDYTFSPSTSFQQEDFSGRVYVRVHATDGFLTDYDETYFEIVQDE